VPAILVLGVTDRRNEYQRDGKILKVNYLSMNRLHFLVSNCKLVICRSGYSSIMDLVATETPALLIPTPGQTEQLYLAKHLQNHRLFQSVSQRSFQELKHL